MRRDFIRAVRSSADDAALAIWFLACPAVTSHAIDAWNEFAPKLGARGQPGHFIFLIVKPFFYSKAKGTHSIFEAIARDEMT